MPATTQRTYLQFKNVLRVLNAPVYVQGRRVRQDESQDIVDLKEGCKLIIRPTFYGPERIKYHGQKWRADTIRASVRILVEPVDRDQTEVLEFVASLYDDNTVDFVANGYISLDPDHRAFAKALGIRITPGEWDLSPDATQIGKLAQYLRAYTGP